MPRPRWVVATVVVLGSVSRGYGSRERCTKRDNEEDENKKKWERGPEKLRQEHERYKATTVKYEQTREGGLE